MPLVACTDLGLSHIRGEGADWIRGLDPPRPRVLGPLTYQCRAVVLTLISHSASLIHLKPRNSLSASAFVTFGYPSITFLISFGATLKLEYPIPRPLRTIMSGQPSPPQPRHRRPRHQPVQTAWTYTRLYRELNDGQILLRVHHSMSASQLILSPSPSTSGFFAPSPLFACVTPKTYALVASNVDPESPWMRELLVDHIRGTRRPYLGRNASEVRPPDELSPWISCTASLDWAIWDIARCLARGGRWSVTLTIVRTGELYSLMSDAPGRSSDHCRRSRAMGYTLRSALA